MNGWTARAMDVEIGDETIDWAVEPSDAHAVEGEQALRLHADNRTDAAKVWAERAFDLAPRTAYRVRVRYQFGTSDWGDLNNWTIIAGVHATPPRTQDALVYQEGTGHSRDTRDLVWLDKAYAFGSGTADSSTAVTARTDGDGTLYVAIGVWGTFEVARTYYVDALTVTFTPVG